MIIKIHDPCVILGFIDFNGLPEVYSSIHLRILKVFPLLGEAVLRIVSTAVSYHLKVLLSGFL